MSNIRKHYEKVVVGNRYDLSKAGEHTMCICQVNIGPLSN